MAYEKYEKISALGDAVDMIAERFADISPIIIDKDGSVIEVEEVQKILSNPNPLNSYSEFANTMAVNFLLTRNAFVEVLGFFKTKPSEIHNVCSSAVTINEETNSALFSVNLSGFYSFLSGNFSMDTDNYRILNSNQIKEIYHSRGYSKQSSGLFANNKVSSVKKDLDILNSSLLHVKNLLEKGFSAGSVINVDTEDREAFEQFKKDIATNFSGSGNKGKALVAKGNSVGYTKIDQSNKDMESLKNKQDSRESIYQRFDIPKPLIDSSSQTYSNYQTALFALYDNAVLPLAHKLYQTLTKIFIDRGMLKDGQRITYNANSIPALQIRRNEEIKLLKETDILTINELRSKVGYEGVSDGGDDIYINASNVPIGKDLFTEDNLSERKKKFLFGYGKIWCG